MTSRELRALQAEGLTETLPRTRSRKAAASASTMSESDDRMKELEAALAAAIAKADKTAEELDAANQRAEDATKAVEELEHTSQRRIDELEKELEYCKLRAEVDRLTAVETVREQEREHLRKLSDELKERHKIEKKMLEEKVAILEATKSTGAVSLPFTSLGGNISLTKPGTLTALDSSRDPPVTSSGPPVVAITTASTSPSLLTPTALVASKSAVSSGTSTGIITSTTTPTTLTTAVASATTGTHTTTVTSAPITVTSSTASPPAVTSGTADPAVISTASGADMISKMLEAQSQMFAAHVQAAALPPLTNYEGRIDDEDGFERWLEKFEERAKLAKWSEEVKLCQLKLHLAKTADQVFHGLSSEQKSTYANAVTALKARFRPIAIEELRGWDFHRRLQGDESIEALGMDLQRLGRKAFPTLEGRDFDRMLKGRFFQALIPKWQRKLGAPRLDESFVQLFERARMIEEHDKQYSESASVRADQNAKKSAPTRSTPSNQNRSQPRPVRPPTSTPVQSSPSNRPIRLCHSCGQPGHLARECPAKQRREAPGRSRPVTTSNTSCVTPQESKAVSDLTEEDLVNLLAQRRLQTEQQLLDHPVSCVVTSSGVTGKAVGPSLFIDLDVGGVPVAAMVDSGSPTTIISRGLLRQVADLCRREKKELPKLTTPSVRLYGKDGPGSGPELVITAQTDLTFKAAGKTVTIPVFIQPNSKQSCLLGTNAAEPLGLLFLDSMGKPLRTTPSEPKPETTCVALIQATTIPSQQGRFLKAKLSQDYSPGKQFLFEPEIEGLENLGLSGVESLVTVRDEGTVFIPVQNLQGQKICLPSGTTLGKVETFDGSKPIPCLDEQHCGSVVADIAKQQSTSLIDTLDFSQCDCSPPELQQLKALLADNADVFALDPSQLGCCGLVQHAIDTGDKPPLKQPPYRTPVVRREKVAQLIKEMQEQGIVQPSSSAWASPVVLVPKKDGSLRFCVDYRRLNAITKKDVYPLPRIDDILDTLGRAKYFSTLDLASGYWQVEIDPGSRQKTAFAAHCGLYEFNRMPFGLCNAPATFQRLMQVVLSGLEWDCCYVYLDDILVASQTFEEHLRHLQLVLDRLRKAGLRLKPAKCLFLCREVPYLGFVISKSGIKPDPTKTDKVENFPTPTDATKVRQFVGLASYYRRFVPGFAKIAAPLHFLTKKRCPILMD